MVDLSPGHLGHPQGPYEATMEMSSLALLLASSLFGIYEVGAQSVPGPALELVAFEELAAAPELWLGSTVETIVQVRGAVSEPWEGFLSGLSPRTHIALEVWGDRQQLWEAEAYAATLGRLHIPAPVFFVTALGAALAPREASNPWRKHTRLRVQVHVEAYTAGRGWLTVVRAEPTAEQVPEGTVLHAIRGLALEVEGAYSLAASELEKALLAPLPDHQRAPLFAALERVRETGSPSARRSGGG